MDIYCTPSQVSPRRVPKKKKKRGISNVCITQLNSQSFYTKTKSFTTANPDATHTTSELRRWQPGGGEGGLYIRNPKSPENPPTLTFCSNTHAHGPVALGNRRRGGGFVCDLKPFLGSNWETAWTFV